MDTATLQQVRSRLTQVEGSLARLLNHLPGMAYRCRVTGNYQYSLEFVSKGSQTLIGIQAEDLLHNAANVIERMMAEGDCEATRATMHDSIVSNKPYEVFYRVILASGEMKWIWDQGEGIYDEDGNCVFLEGIMMDVTGQKNKERVLFEENRQLRSSIKNSYGLGRIVGKSASMQKMYSLIVKSAGSDTSVILYGETGVGKDLAARTIHDLHGTKGRYVAVNCGAIPEQLLESEFFGHVKGAFSGATNNHAGYLVAAHEGTLFLDEVAELPLTLQVKLLRAIESKTYTPVGSSDIKRSNFRLISATNQDLEDMVRRRAMRADFFYRIHVLAIHLPPLRNRPGDLPLLIDAYARERGMTEIIPPSVRFAMEQYSWPGNVRELQNALDRHWAFGDAGLPFGPGDTVEYETLPLPREGGRPFAEPGLIAVTDGSGSARLTASEKSETSVSLRFAKGELEKNRIRAMLDQCNWRRGQTAEALGITMRTLQRKMKCYGIGAASK